MKKNVMMRLAAILLVCVLASTCGISGTYAKYVTTASGNDTARVAKFGVQLFILGGSFADQYKTDDATYSSTIEYSVDSDNGDNVVAPGTKDDGSFTFEIKGTPEVAVKVDCILADTFKDVYLKAGTYIDYTKVLGYTAGGEAIYGQFTLTEDYYPIVYTLTKDGTKVKSGNLATIKAYLDEYTNGAAFGPNVTLDTEFVLSWEWVFEHGANETEIALYDAADTWLGNAAAGINLDGAVVDDDYSTTISYDLTITVTQID